MGPIIIPEDFIEFLHWVKHTTETVWSNELLINSDFNWAYGARWIGMDESQVTETEKKYGIQFTPEHKAFLKILHTIDRKEVVKDIDDLPNGEQEITTWQVPFFYNWLQDDKEIWDRMDFPFRTILDDVFNVNYVWLKSWGKRPVSDERRTEIFSNWYSKAPKLIPVTSHRFAVSDMSLADRPVLSVWGADTIVFGWDFREYLLKELGDHLFLVEIMNKTSNVDEISEQIRNAVRLPKEILREKYIPYWKELILYYSSGWRSFGLDYPYPKTGGAAIVNTYKPEDEE